MGRRLWVRFLEVGLQVDGKDMPKPLLVTHTIKSHGVQVVRLHMHDWLILALLMVLEFVLFASISLVCREGNDGGLEVSTQEQHCTLLDFTLLLFVVFFTGVITNAIKDVVGRPRPDFFWWCFPDGKDVYDPFTGGVICHGQDNLMKDGHKSFPSGHTSWSFAGLGFFSLYLSGKVQAFDQKGHVAKLCIVFLPLLIAVLVGISLVDDYQHHRHDVFAGGFLGMTVATFCYLQFFPASYHSHGWVPYAYLQLLEGLGRNREESDYGYIPLTEVGTA